MDDKLTQFQADCRQRGEPIPDGLPNDLPLLTVPKGLRRIMDRDMVLADNPKVDEHGRNVDVHALRTTFGTHLSKAGVPPRTAQAAMRHSVIGLTINVYRDPRPLDIVGEVDALPSQPLDDSNTQAMTESAMLQATGTDDENLIAETVALTLGNSGTPETITDNLDVDSESANNEEDPKKQCVSRGFQ